MQFARLMAVKPSGFASDNYTEQHNSALLYTAGWIGFSERARKPGPTYLYYISDRAFVLQEEDWKCIDYTVQSFYYFHQFNLKRFTYKWVVARIKLREAKKKKNKFRLTINVDEKKKKEKNLTIFLIDQGKKIWRNGTGKKRNGKERRKKGGQGGGKKRKSVKTCWSIAFTGTFRTNRRLVVQTVNVWDAREANSRLSPLFLVYKPPAKRRLNTAYSFSPATIDRRRASLNLAHDRKRRNTRRQVCKPRFIAAHSGVHCSVPRSGQLIFAYYSSKLV